MLTDWVYDEGHYQEMKGVYLFNSIASEQLTRATEHLPDWCPVQDELLTHATWLDFEHRPEKKLSLSAVFSFAVPGDIS
jgi:hypothetical protein